MKGKTTKQVGCRWESWDGHTAEMRSWSSVGLSRESHVLGSAIIYTHGRVFILAPSKKVERDLSKAEREAVPPNNMKRLSHVLN